MKTCCAEPGENVHQFFKRVCYEAYLSGTEISATFNGTSVDVSPQSYYMDIVYIWHFKREMK